MMIEIRLRGYLSNVGDDWNISPTVLRNVGRYR